MPEYCTAPPEDVEWAMKQCAAVLAKPSSDKGNRALMARLLVHFIGDIHQPLHASSLFSDSFPHGDSGGNSIHLSPPAPTGSYTSANLHSFWDSGGPASGLEQVKKGDIDASRYMAEVIDDREAADIAATPLASLSAINALFAAMVEESYQYAKNTTYGPALLDSLGKGTTVNTNGAFWSAYAESTSELSKQRLKLAGARMAQVINALYSPKLILD